MKRIFFLALFVLLSTIATAADTLICGLPLDVVVLDHDDRQSLQTLFRNASAPGTSPLSAFWSAWNDAALDRGANSLAIIQKIAFEGVIADPAITFSVLYDSRTAIAKVASGELALAWVEGDVLRDEKAKTRLPIREVAYGRSYFEQPDQEDFVLAARVDRKFPPLGLLDAEGMKRAAALIQRNSLRLGYAGMPEEALRPLREARLIPFSADSSLAPNLYVRKYDDGVDGIEKLISGKNRQSGVDLAVVEPKYWEYYVSQYPGRSRFATPVWATADFVVLARANEITGNRLSLDDKESLRFLKRARLGIYTFKARDKFVAALSVSPIGRRALTYEILPPIQNKLESGEDSISAVVYQEGLDIVLARKRSLDIYGEQRPGAYRNIEIIGKLPPIPPPALIANPRSISADIIAHMQDQLQAYNWRTSELASTLVLLRGFSHYSIPEGGNR